MTTNLSLDRREFLKTSGALVVGFSMFGAASAQNAQALRTPKSVAKEAVDSWLTISPDNRVTVYCGKVDLGTGRGTRRRPPPPAGPARGRGARRRLRAHRDGDGRHRHHARPVADRGEPHDFPGRLRAAARRRERAPRSRGTCGPAAVRPGG